MEPKHFESLYPAITRKDDIARIVSILKAGNACQLLSLPGVGRGTVLGLLAYNRKVRELHFGEQQDQVHFVLCDFSEIRKRSLPDATKFLFLCLSESLRERNKEEEYKKVSELFTKSIASHDELILFQGMKQAISYLTLEKKLGIVFLFDRFEEYISTVTQEFFANLRVLRNVAKFRFSVVFSLNRPLDELLEPTLFADFYEYLAGHSVFLPLRDEAGMDYRKVYLEKMTGKKITDDMYHALLRLTGGHAKLTKLAMEAYLSNQIEDRDLGTFLLSMRTIRGAVYEIWNSLTPAERVSIFDEKDESYLMHSGLVAEGEIQIPLFERYLQEKEQEFRAEKNQLRFDASSQTIFQGELPLSDTLTASEFRFLRYLIEHPGTILDRNQVIDVVWQDAKSTAGVSDEAVDQLVFRLRKKIETDPKNPIHLLTVKGRGFSFNP